MLFLLKKFFFAIWITWLAGNLIFIYLQFDEIDLSDENFLNLKSCPFCYGHSLCSNIQFKTGFFNFKLSKSLHNKYLFQDLFNIKNVFFLDETVSGGKAVLKKLAHSHELNSFDSKDLNSMKNFLMQNRDKFEKQFESDFFRKASEHLGIQILTCFTPRLARRVYKTFHEEETSARNFTIKNLILLTTLKINPEPVVLQMFPQRENWPFPNYYGSCGRVIIESYHGKTLNNFIEHDFLTRAKISKLLLEALKTLTTNEHNVSLYLLDLGYENVSYDEPSDKIYFIDVEDVLIVDKLAARNETSYVMPFDDCSGETTDCLKYQAEELCQFRDVDINFYSACRILLSQHAKFREEKIHFLHSIPKEIDEQFGLNALLDNCAKLEVTSKDQNRFEVVERILSVLNKIEKN